jgi:hypothetical protein
MDNPMDLKQIAANQGAFGVAGQVAVETPSGIGRACAPSRSAREAQGLW